MVFLTISLLLYIQGVCFQDDGGISIPKPSNSNICGSESGMGGLH